MVLVELKPGDPPLPAELEDALREWAAFAAAVSRTGRSAEQELLRRRGRQLASRVADVLGRPIDFVDPVSDTVESIRVGATEPDLRRGTRGQLDQRLAVEPSGPTPWATGLVVSGFFVVVVALADTVLNRAFAEAFGLLWVPANLLVVIGLAPSLYLLRSTPFWRWPAWGTAIGLGVAWVVLLLGLLGA